MSIPVIRQLEALPLPLPGQVEMTPSVETTPTFTRTENAGLDKLYPHEELVKKAKKSPPPEAWYDEEFIR